MKALAAAALLALPAVAAGTGPVAAHCQCVGNGTKYEQGELACLRLPSGPILARCDKVYNNSSWTKVGDGCPQARDDMTNGNLSSQPSGKGNGGRRPFSLFDFFRG